MQIGMIKTTLHTEAELGRNVAQNTFSYSMPNNQRNTQSSYVCLTRKKNHHLQGESDIETSFEN
jgi:hypothetical protein